MPSAAIFYHFFYPDDVVSAFHHTELAEGLAARGWDVTAMPCNRSCRHPGVSYPMRDTHAGISIRRIWRPPFPQASSWGRIANCAWMAVAWSLRCLVDKPDVLIIGSDPVLSVLAAIPWKIIRPQTHVVHWCFDLYPEAAIADGIFKSRPLLSLLRSVITSAYRRLDLIADIGSCMRERLSSYRTSAKMTTLPPWALAEPASPLPVDAAQRSAIFGDAKLALMYSGNFGRAHSVSEVLDIARGMRDVDAHFAFSIRGNCAKDAEFAVRPEDSNISFVSFASQDQLELRLSAADIHIVSLRSEWTGSVVPSKFFGALAAGRPVLFVGSEDCSIARLIRKYGLGWVCSPGKENSIAEELRELANSPEPVRKMGEHCHRVYQRYLSREFLLNQFDFELRALLSERTEAELNPRKAEMSTRV